jgi:metal-responsive CopG/Arc/MetJ family transcriptional regulator
MSRADEFRNATKLERTERLQIKLPPDELAAIDAFRYETRMPSRAAAVRELLRRGLALPEPTTREQSYQKV